MTDKERNEQSRITQAVLLAYNETVKDFGDKVYWFLADVFGKTRSIVESEQTIEDKERTLKDKFFGRIRSTPNSNGVLPEHHFRDIFVGILNEVCIDTDEYKFTVTPNGRVIVNDYFKIVGFYLDEFTGERLTPPEFSFTFGDTDRKKVTKADYEKYSACVDYLEKNFKEKYSEKEDIDILAKKTNFSLEDLENLARCVTDDLYTVVYNILNSKGITAKTLTEYQNYNGSADEINEYQLTQTDKLITIISSKSNFFKFFIESEQPTEFSEELNSIIGSIYDSLIEETREFTENHIDFIE